MYVAHVTSPSGCAQATLPQHLTWHHFAAAGAGGEIGSKRFLRPPLENGDSHWARGEKCTSPGETTRPQTKLLREATGGAGTHRSGGNRRSTRPAVANQGGEARQKRLHIVMQGRGGVGSGRRWGGSSQSDGAGLAVTGRSPNFAGPVLPGTFRRGPTCDPLTNRVALEMRCPTARASPRVVERTVTADHGAQN